MAGVPPQNVSRALSCTVRAPLVEVKRPKLPASIPVEIPLKLVWLSELNMSPRSCSRQRSVMARFFATARSRFQNPGARSALRPTLPKRSGAFAIPTGIRAKAARYRYCSVVLASAR